MDNIVLNGDGSFESKNLIISARIRDTVTNGPGDILIMTSDQGRIFLDEISSRQGENTYVGYYSFG